MKRQNETSSVSKLTSISEQTDLPLSEQLLDEVGDVSAGDGNVFDAGSNDVTFGHGNHVGHAVSAVDHRSRQRSLTHL